MSNTPKNQKTITDLKKRYILSSKGKESLVKILLETEISEHVYNSNAIENSTLTLEETEKLLLQLDLDRYVSEREIHEAKNLARVTEYVGSRASGKILDFNTILFMHKMLLGNINENIAGRFRQTGEYVRVGDHIASPPEEVEALLYEVFAEFEASDQTAIISRIARLHLGFESIHPFIDGNGRIGRVINNYLLIRNGYVPINIQFIDRLLYYRAFKEFADDNSTKTMEDIVSKALTNSYHRRLAYLEGKNIITLKDYSIQSRYSHSDLINRAKRQTIEAFSEKGVWKIGIEAT